MENPASSRRLIVIFAGYGVILASGMYLCFHRFGVAYGDPRMVRVLIWFQMVLGAYAVASARWLYGSWTCGFVPLRPRGWLWAAPLLVVMAALGAEVLPQMTGGHLGLTLTVVATMLLVGLSEEVMFRGILLRHLLGRTSPRRAVVWSSLAFSAMHLINLMAGSPPFTVGVQLVFTFVFGLTFACMALRLNSLWPLVLMHGGWDMLLFIAVLERVDLPWLMLAALPVLVGVPVIAWRGLGRDLGRDPQPDESAA